jgi:hypothetical protein
MGTTPKFDRLERTASPTLADLILQLRCTLPTPEDACEGYGVIFTSASHCTLVDVEEREFDGSYRVVFDDESVLVVEESGARWTTKL